MAYNYEYPYVDAQQYNNDWLIHKVKELALEWAQVKKDWTTQQEAFESLRTYINNYFKNLDVQEEINNKLENMLSSGDLQKYLYPYILSMQSPLFVNDTSLMTDTSKYYVLTSTGQLFSYIDGSFQPTGFVYGVGENIVKGYGVMVNQSNIEAVLPDFNNALINTIYNVSNISLSKNYPPGLNNAYGTLITLTGADEVVTTNYRVQFLFSGDAHIYYRYKLNNIWNDWKKTTDRDTLIEIVPTFINSANYQGLLSDFNLAKVNKIYSIRNIGDILHFPEFFTSNIGTLFTFGATDTMSPNFKVQMLFSESGTIATRYKSNNIWTEWNNLTAPPTPSAEDLEKKYFLKTCVNITQMSTNKNEKWATFGDSITARNQWQTELSKITGMTFKNFAVEGATYTHTHTAENLWVSTQIASADLSDCTAIIVWAGINDARYTVNGMEIQQAVEDVITSLTTFNLPICFITPMQCLDKSRNNNGIEIGGIIENTALTANLNVINGHDIPLYTGGIDIYSPMTLDGLHPNATGYTVIAKILSSILPPNIFPSI